MTDKTPEEIRQEIIDFQTMILSGQEPTKEQLAAAIAAHRRHRELAQTNNRTKKEKAAEAKASLPVNLGDLFK